MVCMEDKNLQYKVCADNRLDGHPIPERISQILHRHRGITNTYCVALPLTLLQVYYSKYYKYVGFM